MDILAKLRTLSLIEGTTYLVLLTFAVIKRTNDWELGVQVMGPVHGVIFVILALLILQNSHDLGWKFGRAVVAIVLGAVPLGAFWLERNWLQSAGGGDIDAKTG